MKHQLLLQQLGENATTAKDPVAEVLRVDGRMVTARWPDGTERTVSLDEQTTCCVAYDNNMLCQVPLWGVGEVDVPEFCTRPRVTDTCTWCRR